MTPIVITEKVWANCQLSIARHTGRVRIDNHEYIIVDKRGHDIFQCSAEAMKQGRAKAIEPGEPADLCRMDFLPIYRKLGRERMLRFLKIFPNVKSAREARILLKDWPNDTCRTCGFYENNCPFIRGKLIPYPNKVCKDYVYSVMKAEAKEK